MDEVVRLGEGGWRGETRFLYESAAKARFAPRVGRMPGNVTACRSRVIDSLLHSKWSQPSSFRPPHNSTSTPVVTARQAVFLVAAAEGII